MSRISQIEIDDSNLPPPTPEIEQERKVAIFDLLEDNSFTWPAIKNGVMRLEPAQFEALFAGLDWRRVRPLEVAAPAAAE